MHHVDTIGLSCSTTMWYIPPTTQELRIFETQPLSYNWGQTMKKLQYDSSQKISYHCADSVSGIRWVTMTMSWTITAREFRQKRTRYPRSG